MNPQEFLKRDAFAVMLGIELTEAANGTARAKLTLNHQHLNGVGIAHGGVIFSLADFTLAAAANSHGKLAVAINSGISFVKAAEKGTIYAHARETSINAKLATYIIEVTNQQNELIATMQGMVYRKKEVY